MAASPLAKALIHTAALVAAAAFGAKRVNNGNVSQAQYQQGMKGAGQANAKLWNDYKNSK
ncbi:MAG: hypothetical protein ACI4Q5_08375 [Porcipelethomonas sp.]